MSGRDSRLSVMGRYRLWTRPAQTPRVIDSQRRDDECVVAICSKAKDAEMIVAALNDHTGAVEALRDLLYALDDAPALPNDPTWAAIVKARGKLRRLRGGQ